MAASSLHRCINVLGITALLAYVAMALGRDIKGLLIGEAASLQVRNTLRSAIEDFDGVEDEDGLRAAWLHGRHDTTPAVSAW